MKRAKKATSGSTPVPHLPEHRRLFQWFPFNILKQFIDLSRIDYERFDEEGYINFCLERGARFEPKDETHDEMLKRNEKWDYSVLNFYQRDGRVEYLDHLTSTRTCLGTLGRKRIELLRDELVAFSKPFYDQVDVRPRNHKREWKVRDACDAKRVVDIKGLIREVLTERIKKELIEKSTKRAPIAR
jgi:hypothetical protein